MSGKRRLNKRTILMAGLAVLSMAGAATAWGLFLSARSVSGQVIDSSSGRPLSGAVLEAAGQEVRTAADGSFMIPGIHFGATVVADATGYEPVSTVVALDGQLRLALSPWVLQGMTIDGSTGLPVPDVQLVAGVQMAQSDAQGRFRLSGLEPGTQVAARAEGYGAASQTYDGQATSVLTLTPNVLGLTVLDEYTGLPVAGAEAADGKAIVRTDQEGHTRLTYLKAGVEVLVGLEGFAPAKIVYSGQATSEVKLRPNTLSGTVKDSEGRPVGGISVTGGRATVSTDQNGAFKLTDLPENVKITVSGNGFLSQQLEVGRRTIVDVALQPFSARALYLTYYGVGDDDLRNHVLDLAARSEVNAVVIDVKGDRGWIVYPSKVPMVKTIGAQQDVQITDPGKFLADLKKLGVYTIARIVTFKDNPLATSRPDLAVINSATGMPWVDNEGLSWTDPTRPEVWDYNVDLAVEAIENGFDEVQFDYVRFPTDASAGNSLDSITFSQANRMANRVAAIDGFLERALQAVHAKGGLVSADIFGYVVWRDDDMGIGQHLEDVAQHVDYVSPMLYPTLFWDGLPTDGGDRYANSQAGNYPYEVVSESMKIAVKRIGAAKLRPWLQYYNDYINGKTYTAADMDAQKKAVYDAGVDGWLFWDPSNRYVKGGFDPQ